MSLINFPAAVDTFSTINAAGGDNLNTTGKEHDTQHNKVTQAVVQLERITAGPTLYNIAGHPSWDPAASDNTAAVQGTMTAAPSGAWIVVPNLPSGIGINQSTPLQMARAQKLIGHGEFNSRLKLLGDTASPLLDILANVDSGYGVWGNYGPGIDGIGFDLTAAPSSIGGFRITGTAGWATAKNFNVVGGTHGFEIRGPNATIDGFRMSDQSDAGFFLDQSGLECCIRNGKIARNNSGALGAYFKCVLTAGGALGELQISNVSGTANIGGGSSVTNLFVITATTSAILYTFMTDCRWDNGSGPAILTNIQRFKMNGGYLNAAAGSTGAVKMDGCTVPKFTEVEIYGGTRTYEFTGATTYGFKSACQIATGPAYYINTTNKPTEINVRGDHIDGATNVSQVTNDPTWFFDASSRLWGSVRVQGMIRQSEQTPSPPQGFGTMVAGVLTVSHPNVQTNTRILFWRETTGATGTPGWLQHDVADNIVSTSFKLKSSSNTDTSRVGWKFLGDAD